MALEKSKTFFLCYHHDKHKFDQFYFIRFLLKYISNAGLGALNVINYQDFLDAPSVKQVCCI